MRSRTAVVVAVLVVLVLAGGGGLLLVDRSDPSAEDGAAGSTGSTTSTVAAASTSAAPSSGSTASSSSSASSTPSASASSGGRSIEISRDRYFGRPNETIDIDGTYVGATGPTELEVQVRLTHGWTTFPLPAVTRPSGRFRAFVELGQGQYQLRIVDPATGTTSDEVTVLLF